MRLLFFLGKARPPAREAATRVAFCLMLWVRAGVALALVGMRGKPIPSIARATNARILTPTSTRHEVAASRAGGLP